MKFKVPKIFEQRVSYIGFALILCRTSWCPNINKNHCIRNVTNIVKICLNCEEDASKRSNESVRVRHVTAEQTEESIRKSHSMYVNCSDMFNQAKYLTV